MNFRHTRGKDFILERRGSATLLATKLLNLLSVTLKSC